MEKLETGTKYCPRCGNKFSCSASPRCWCYEISLSPATLEFIENNYDSCLCPQCLTLLASDEKELLLEN
jgi:uncharacterized protein (UPF0212 family)